jgi:hypothetical protein
MTFDPRASSKRMLLQPPGGPWLPLPPTIVQATFCRAGNVIPAFGVATTVGNKLLYMATERDNTCVVPLQETWTDLVGHTVQFQRDGGANEQGQVAYATEVTVARTSYSRSLNRCNLVIWEIANTSLAGITGLDLSDQASGPVHDLGSLGVLDANRLAFAMIGMGGDFGYSITPDAAWVVDFLAGRDLQSTTNSLGGTPNYPGTWWGHLVGPNATVRARIQNTSSHKWGGIAVLLA